MGKSFKQYIAHFFWSIREKIKPLAVVVNKIGILFRTLYLFFPGLFFLAVYYFILVRMPQGQDILMQTVEHPWSFIWTVISVFLCALFTWFSSRLVSDFYIRKNYVDSFLLKHVPRLLGYNVFVALQIAVLNLPTIGFSGKIKATFLFLFILQNAYYFLLDKAMETRRKKIIILALLFAIGYLSFITYAFSINIRKGDFFVLDAFRQHIWIWLMTSIGFFLLQIAFVYFVVERRNRIDNEKYDEKDYKWWMVLYNLCAIITFGIYVAIITFPLFACTCGPLSCLLLALSLWIGAIYFIKYYSLKWKVRFGIPILIIALLIGLCGDPYKVNLQEATQPDFYNKRANVKTYLTKWVTDDCRYETIKKADSSKPYITYLVIADGGASKSGYWVGSVLSKLEESDGKNKFSEHLLSLAGASGGSVGNVAFYSLLSSREKGNKNVRFSEETKSFLSADFLSYTLSHYLTSDFLKHFLPILPINDRASALEESMEKISESRVINTAFQEPINNLFDDTGKLPILFVNTTNLQTGTPGVISNIKINNDFTERLDVLQQLDSVKDQSGKRTGKNMKLSTAVVLGARFPYLSPAGEINGKYYVDGGYYDNSGGGITLELLRYIDEYVKDKKGKKDILADLLKNMRFKIIYISNGERKKSNNGMKLHPLVNDLAAPLLTVVGTYGEQTTMSNKKLEDFMNKWDMKVTKQSPYQTLNLPMKKAKNQSCISGRDMAPPYPMNWVISDYNLERMERNLECVDPKSVLIHY